jgi:hypothetical protein
VKTRPAACWSNAGDAGQIIYPPFDVQKCTAAPSLQDACNTFACQREDCPLLVFVALCFVFETVLFLLQNAALIGTNRPFSALSTVIALMAPPVSARIRTRVCLCLPVVSRSCLVDPAGALCEVRASDGVAVKVGGAVGGVVLIALLIGAVVYWRRRKAAAAAAEAGEFHNLADQQKALHA